MDDSTIKKIQMTVGNNMSMIQYIKLEYSDGTTHIGFISKINNNFSPPMMTFTDRAVPRGAVGEHIIDFDYLTKMTVKFYKQTDEQVFEG